MNCLYIFPDERIILYIGEKNIIYIRCRCLYQITIQLISKIKRSYYSSFMKLLVIAVHLPPNTGVNCRVGSNKPDRILIKLKAFKYAFEIIPKHSLVVYKLYLCNCGLSRYPPQSAYIHSLSINRIQHDLSIIIVSD